MICIDTYNLQGEKQEKTKLSDAVFKSPASPALLAQSIRVFLSNQRQANAQTKTRGEVAKTTAKMYRQKGTGRARHGAYSAHIFVGGGVSHGPTGLQNYKLGLPAKVKKMSITGALSYKAHANNIFALTSASSSAGKTKEAALFLKNTQLNHSSILLVVSSADKVIRRIFNNLPNIWITLPTSLSAYGILKHSKIIFTQTALSETSRLFDSHKKTS